MSYTNTLAFTPAGVDACALWRMWQAHCNIPHSRYLYTQGTPDINSAAECDVLVVQRLMTEGNIQLLKIIRAHGLKIVYDLDDLCWSLPASNPAARFFHRNESVKGLENCAMWADVITVSTRELKSATEDRWSWLRNVQTGKPIPVVHIDNRMDTKFFTFSALPKNEDKVVIGWGGSNTHEGDVKAVWAILPDIIEKYPRVYLEFVGQSPPSKLQGHPRVIERPYCHISEFHNRYVTWNWDIVLAPLEQHKFNRSKSSIKMQEAAIVASPCLASDIAPYKYFCSFRNDLKWLLCDEYDWEKKLSQLIESKAFREDLGMALRQNVVDNFNIERSAEQWQELAQSLS